MKVTGIIYLKDRITLDDVMSVIRFSKLADESKSRGEKVYYLKKIIRALTTRRFFLTLWDIKQLPKIIEKAALSSSKVPVNDYEDAERKIIDIASSIGAKVHKLPNEVLSGMTSQELEVYSLHVLIDYYEKALSQLYAYHAPSEYGKQVNKGLEKLRNQTKQFTMKKAVDKLGVESYETEKIMPSQVFSGMLC